MFRRWNSSNFAFASLSLFKISTRKRARLMSILCACVSGWAPFIFSHEWAASEGKSRVPLRIEGATFFPSGSTRNPMNSSRVEIL